MIWIRQSEIMGESLSCSRVGRWSCSRRGVQQHKGAGGIDCNYFVAFQCPRPRTSTVGHEIHNSLDQQERGESKACQKRKKEKIAEIRCRKIGSESSVAGGLSNASSSSSSSSSRSSSRSPSPHASLNPASKKKRARAAVNELAAQVKKQASVESPPRQKAGVQEFKFGRSLIS